MTRKEELYLEEKDLYEKINKIREEKEEIRQQELKEKKKIVADKIRTMRENKDIILSLLAHDRTSCNDKNPFNGFDLHKGYARCDKCFLIEILNGEYEDGEFDVNFSINITSTDIY